MEREKKKKNEALRLVMMGKRRQSFVLFLFLTEMDGAPCG